MLNTVSVFYLLIGSVAAGYATFLMTSGMSMSLLTGTAFFLLGAAIERHLTGQIISAVMALLGAGVCHQIVHEVSKNSEAASAVAIAYLLLYIMIISLIRSLFAISTPQNEGPVQRHYKMN